MSAGLEGKLPRDFPSWLHPVVVKELRQGLRGRYFVTVFLVLQAVLLFSVAGQMSDAARGVYNAQAGAAGFWGLTGMLIGVALPAAGFGALHGERRAMTLELLQMTRLSARGIVWGKWLALAVQAGLMAAAVFPWAALRYLLGGVELAREAEILGLLLAGGLTMSAYAVGLSALRSRVARLAAVIGALTGAQVIGGLFFSALLAGGSGKGVFGGVSFGAAEWGMLLGWCVVSGLAALEFGAARIALPAETRAWPLRLLGWAGLVPGVAGMLLRRESGGFFLWAGVCLLGVMCAGAVVERVRGASGSYRVLARFGRLGRLAGRVFYPGWPSGVIYTVISSGWVWLALRAADAGARDAALFVALAAGAVVVPAAMTRLALDAMRSDAEMGTGYFVIQTLSVFVWLFLRMLPDGGETAARFFCFLPLSVLLRAAGGGVGPDETGFYLAAGWAALVAAVAALAVLSLPRWRLVAEIERGPRG